MNKRDEYHGSSYVTKPSFDPEIIAKQDEKYPKISIVMPSYNQGQFIERSILSVINQNYPNTELIIIDGGSDDETVDILKKYNDYITFWVSETDRGQSHAINKGIDRSSGELITWLNADDLLLPNALKGIGKEWTENNKPKWIAGNTIRIDENGDILHKAIEAKNEKVQELVFKSISQMAWDLNGKKKIKKRNGI